MMAERARRNAARLAEAHERFEAAKEDFETNVDAKYFASLAAWEDKRAELLVEAETAKRCARHHLPGGGLKDGSQTHIYTQE